MLLGMLSASATLMQTAQAAPQSQNGAYKVDLCYADTVHNTGINYCGSAMQAIYTKYSNTKPTFAKDYILIRTLDDDGVYGFVAINPKTKQAFVSPFGVNTYYVDKRGYQFTSTKPPRLYYGKNRDSLCSQGTEITFVGDGANTLSLFDEDPKLNYCQAFIPNEGFEGSLSEVAGR